MPTSPISRHLRTHLTATFGMERFLFFSPCNAVLLPVQAKSNEQRQCPEEARAAENQVRNAHIHATGYVGGVTGF